MESAVARVPGPPRGVSVPRPTRYCSNATRAAAVSFSERRRRAPGARGARVDQIILVCIHYICCAPPVYISAMMQYALYYPAFIWPFTHTGHVRRPYVPCDALLVTVVGSADLVRCAWYAAWHSSKQYWSDRRGRFSSTRTVVYGYCTYTVRGVRVAQPTVPVRAAVPRNLPLPAPVRDRSLRPAPTASRCHARTHHRIPTSHMGPILSVARHSAASEPAAILDREVHPFREIVGALPCGE